MNTRKSSGTSHRTHRSRKEMSTRNRITQPQTVAITLMEAVMAEGKSTDFPGVDDTGAVHPDAFMDTNQALRIMINQIAHTAFFSENIEQIQRFVDYCNTSGTICINCGPDRRDDALPFGGFFDELQSI